MEMLPQIQNLVALEGVPGNKTLEVCVFVARGILMELWILRFGSREQRRQETGVVWAGALTRRRFSQYRISLMTRRFLPLSR